MTKALPVLMAVLSLGAAVVYLLSGDIRHGCYWLPAGALTTLVTFW
jgi:hypothetical protein